jgi:DNA (cytosine-5)-methyltransferase 1
MLFHGVGEGEAVSTRPSPGPRGARGEDRPAWRKVRLVAPETATIARSARSHDPSGDARAALLAWHATAQPRSGSEAGSPDPVRSAARDLGSRVALNLDDHWGAERPAGKIRVVELFSGCGGLSIGFSALNAVLPAYRLMVALDMDPIANATYAANFGKDADEVDIGGLAADPALLKELVRRSSGEEDDAPLIVVGGPPCQGFSSHRAKDATDGRNSLVRSFAEVAVSLDPDAILLENVPELLTDRHWPLLDSALDVLREAGYCVSVGVHNTAEFGVPQDRFRAVVLAAKRPISQPTGLLDRPNFRTVRDAIGHLPAIRAGERTHAERLHFTAAHRQSTIETLQAVPKDGGNRPPHVGPECLRRGAVRQGKPLYEDVYGRLAWDRPAVTITNYARNPASGRYGHPEQDRGLSIREAALLQGFPSEYQFSGALDPCFRQIGNAVPPRFSAALAAHLLGEILAETESPDASPGITDPVGPSFARLIPALKAGSRVL